MLRSLFLCAGLLATTADVIELETQAAYDSAWGGADNTRLLNTEGASVIIFINDAEANWKMLKQAVTEHAALAERTYSIVTKDTLIKAEKWKSLCHDDRKQWKEWCATVHTLGEDGTTALLARSTHAQTADGSPAPQDRKFMDKFLTKAIAHKNMGDLVKAISHDEL